MSKRVLKMGWLGLIIAALVIMPACGTGNGGGPIPLLNPGDFIQQTIGDLDSLDPAWAYDTSSGEQIGYIYEPLLYYNGTSTGQFVPVLAVNWTIVNTTQIRFCIRSGVNFSNGNALTASDVEYSFERAMVQDRDSGPTNLYQTPLLGVYSTRDDDGNIRPGILDKIQNSVVVDGDCVVFNQDPVKPLGWTGFLQILCGQWASIVDKEWCMAHGEWDGTANNGTGNSTQWTYYNNPTKQASYLYEHAMGTGPWKLQSWAKTDNIHLVKNANYWNEGVRPVPFNNVITEWVQEWNSRKLALLAGEADYIYVPRQYIGELLNNTELNMYDSLPDIGSVCMHFNQNISATSTYIGSKTLDGNGIPVGFFNDTNVRQAFSYAFDYDTFINDLYMGEALHLGSPLVSCLTGYYDYTPKYALCLTIAQNLLETSGWGNLSEVGFKFNIFYNQGNTVREAACHILANNLRSINEAFDIAVNAMMWSTYLDTIFVVHPSPIPMFTIGWGADYPDSDNFITPYMHQLGDMSGACDYGDSAWDTLIETARYSTNLTEREQIYGQLQLAWHDDPGGVILVQPLGRRFFTKYIHGFFFNPMYPGEPGPLYYMSKS